MPRHRKTRLLHWPAYRLLFLIRVLDWKQVILFSNREQSCHFFIYKTFSHISTAAQTAACWLLKTFRGNGKSIFLLIQTWIHQAHFTFEDLACWFFIKKRKIKENIKPSQLIRSLLSIFSSFQTHFIFCCCSISLVHILSKQAYLCQLLYLIELLFIDQLNQTGPIHSRCKVRQFSWGFLSFRILLDRRV